MLFLERHRSSDIVVDRCEVCQGHEISTAKFLGLMWFRETILALCETFKEVLNWRVIKFDEKKKSIFMLHWVN